MKNFVIFASFVFGLVFIGNTVGAMSYPIAGFVCLLSIILLLYMLNKYSEYKKN